MHRIFFLTLLLSVFLLVASVSKAATISPESTTNNPQIQEWLNKAEKFWGKPLPQCPNGIVVKVAPQAEGKKNVVAWASLNGCYLTYSDYWYPNAPTEQYVGYSEAAKAKYWRQEMCTITTHEYGHLLGYEHDEHKENVMYYAPDYHSNPDCVEPVDPNELLGGAGKEQDFATEDGPSMDRNVQLLKKGKKYSLEIDGLNGGETEIKGVQVCARWSSNLSPTSKTVKKKRINKNVYCFKNQTLKAEGEFFKTLSFVKKGKKKASIKVSINYDGQKAAFKKTVRR